MMHNKGVNIAIGEIRNQCFVIMPFDGLFQSQYELVIKPSIEAAGLECVRGDMIFSKPKVMDDIWKSIRESRAVLAELSGKNTNVFYELGLAHALGKPSLILTRNESDVPFDLKSLRYTYYNTNDPHWGPNLGRVITEMLKNIIEKEDFGSFLEDITISNDLQVREKTAKPIRILHPQEVIDVSGVWSGTWKHYTESVQDSVSATNGKANLDQEMSKISGTIDITTKYKGDETIISQRLSGYVEGENVFLQGVSYSFIQRGKAPTYILDEFELLLVDDHTLKGKVNPYKEHGGMDVILRKE